MKSQNRGGKPSMDSEHSGRGRGMESEYGETDRTQKNASSSDTGSFGENRGDAYIDSDLEEIEQEDDSLLAGGREDVRSSERVGEGGQPSEGHPSKSSQSGKSSQADDVSDE